MAVKTTARGGRTAKGDAAGAKRTGQAAPPPAPSPSDAPPNPEAPADAPQRVGLLATQATLFIQQAASVLEREVAAGIGAARALEHRHVDVAKIRARAPDEVMQRFRRDAHDVVDIIMDLVAVGVRSVEGLADRAVRLTQGPDGAPAPAGPNLPTLSPEAAIAPGGVATLEMALENSSDDVCEVRGFQASDLIAPSGDRIEAARVTFAPAPVAIAAHGKARLTVTVHVPETAPPGVYSGLMMAQQLDQVRALIAVKVEPRSDQPAAA